jgi:WD40 repeat protein
MVTWGWDGRVIVDSIDGRFQRDWGGHGSFVFGACDLPGVGIVTWSHDATARVWTPEGAEKEVFRTRTGGIEAGARAGATVWLGTSPGELYAWSPGQRRVMLFEAGDWHRGAVSYIVGSTDFVASACRSGRLGIWSPENLSNVAFWDVPESGGFSALCASPDGSMVAAGGERGRVIAVDPVEGRIIFDVAAHGATVRGLAFAPDRDVLFSVSGDGTVAAWDRTGELLARARLDGEGYSIAADRGGLIAAGDAAGRVLFFDFATEVH